MRIDFSEPECSNCFHCRTLGILNTQESEPSNVIGSSVTPLLVNSEPVQALGHASAAVGSTSTSSPGQALSHDSAAVGSTSTSSPVQALSHDSAAVGSTSTSSPVQALSHDSAAVGSTSTSSPVQARGHDDSAASGSISTFSFGSQTPSALPVITSVSSEPTQTLGLTSLGSDASGASTVQATSGSGASATSTSSTSSPFQSSSPNSFGFAPAVTSVSSAPTLAFGPNSFGFGASATFTSSTSSPVHSSSPFGFAPAVTSVSSTPTQAFGQTTFGFGSSPNSFGFAPAVTSVSSAPTQAFGPNTFGFNAFPVPTQHRIGSMQAPAQATSGFNLFAAPTQPTLGSMQATAQATSGFNLFAAPTQPSLRSMQAPVQATSGFGAFSDTAPPRFGLGSTQARVEANFGSGASGTSTSSSFLPFGCVPAPPTNGSSLFGPLPSVPCTGVNIFGLGSRYPRYAPTPDGETGSMYTSISASRPKSHPPKSHEEIRWEDYKQGYKGSRTKTFFGYPPMASPSIFASPSVTPGSVSWPAQDFPRTGVNRFALGSSPSNRFGQNISTTGSNSGFPGFGVDYLPGSNSSPFGPNSYTTGGGSIFDGPKTSSAQPFGFNAATTPLPSSSTTFSSNPYTAFNPLPICGWSCHNEQGSRHTRHAPTPDGETGGMYTSISASKSHQHKSHEELRWEDYKQGNKGSKTNTVFGFPPMASPWIFASPSVPDHPQRTTFGTAQESFAGPVSCFAQHNQAFTGFGTQFPHSSSSFFTTFPPISSSVQRPHETTAVSSPASGCTACGSTTSTSASGYLTFNGATSAPPSAATTSLPGMFYPPYGYVPMMFATTPALQAYPFNGYILLPFGAMSLQ